MHRRHKTPCLSHAPPFDRRSPPLLPLVADDSSLLAILLDVSPSAVVHLASTPGLSLQTLLEQLLIFVNAFSLLNDGNRLAVFTAGPSGCQLAYCSPSCLPPAAAAEAAAERGSAPSAEVLKGLQQAIAGTTAAEKAGGGTIAGTSCQFSSALSRMLCFINSLQCRAAAAAAGAGLSGGAGASAGGGASAGVRKQQPMRLLCLTAAPDVPSQYIAVMNSIFSAQVGILQYAMLCCAALCLPCMHRCYKHHASCTQPCVCAAQLPACVEVSKWAPHFYPRRALFLAAEEWRVD